MLAKFLNMKFSTLTVLALISGTSAFVANPSSNSQNRFLQKNIPWRKQVDIVPQRSALRMAEGPYEFDGKPKKKTKKEQLLEEIETKSREAEIRRQALEAELAAAEAERLKLLQEAEKASRLPDARPIDFGAVGGAVPLVGAALTAAVGARQALQGREEMQKEAIRKQQIAKAAAEQDAKNRAAAEFRQQAVKGSVSFAYIFLTTFLTLSCFAF